MQWREKRECTFPLAIRKTHAVLGTKSTTDLLDNLHQVLCVCLDYLATSEDFLRTMTLGTGSKKTMVEWPLLLAANVLSVQAHGIETHIIIPGMKHKLDRD